MNLLIITQKIDRPDPILGFFHRWVEEIAKHFDRVTVICSQVGVNELPKEISVLSLGKEEKQSRWQYITRFYRYIWRERKNYDSVFVHMNQEYVLLAGVLWRLLGKKIYLWRNHKKGNWLTALSIFISHRVFCTSPDSYTARFSKTKIMPIGADVSKFLKLIEVTRVPRSILCAGRIGPVKRIENFIQALVMLDQEGADFAASIVGKVDVGQEAYYENLREMSLALVQKGKLVFREAVPNDKTPEMYGSHEIYVNLTGDGSMDKTIFSAMCSRTLTIVCNNYFRGTLPDHLLFKHGDSVDLARAIRETLALPEQEKRNLGEKLRQYVVENHSLDSLVDQLHREMTNS